MVRFILLRIEPSKRNAKLCVHQHFHLTEKKNYKIKRKFCALHPNEYECDSRTHTRERRTCVIFVQCLRLCFFLFSIYLSSLASRSFVFLFFRILLIHFDFFFRWLVRLPSPPVDFFHFRGFGISLFRSFFSSSLLLLLIRSFSYASCHQTECMSARMDKCLPYVQRTCVSWMHCVYSILLSIFINHNYICIHTPNSIS